MKSRIDLIHKEPLQKMQLKFSFDTTENKISLPTQNQTMSRYIKSFIFIFIIFGGIQSSYAQGMLFGIRAGLSYSQFLGPTTEVQDESFSLANGFHFGINVGYKFNDFVSVRTEILYNQMGTKYKYDGDGYYIFNTVSNSRTVIRDSSKYNLDISNAYMSFPFTVHIKTLEKWEFHAGAYVNFLISPVGTGQLIFGSIDSLNYTFEQGLNYDYNSDLSGEASSFATQIGLIANGQNADLPSLVGAYYIFPFENNTDRKVRSLINSFDYGLTGGVSYFLNPGLYLGLKGWYGLKDVTHNGSDVSYETINSDGSLNFSDHDDRNFSIDVSIGFRF